MAIEETVDWDAVPEDLLLRLVPEDDPEYGGSRQLRLNNARRIYIHMRTHDVFKNMYDKDIVCRLQQFDPERFGACRALAIMMYSGKEGRELGKLVDTNFETWFG